MKAVQFDRYGDVDVLEVRDVDRPAPEPGRVLVAVRAAAINPGEASIRSGALHERWPSTFPSGEGSDFAGVVEEVGEGVSAFAVGDEVAGWTDERASHAEFVSVPVEHVIAKPAQLSWEVAGSLFVAPCAGYACRQAVAPQPGETIVVSAAAGGVGSVAAQLAKVAGANVIGLAGEANHEWLRSRGIVPVAYGEGQAERVRAAADGPIDGFMDTFGGGYVDLAIELGVDPKRINSVIDFEAVERVGAQRVGSSAVVNADVIAELAGLVAAGDVEIPIAKTYPLAEVRAAYADLAHRHTRGKIVLIP